MYRDSGLYIAVVVRPLWFHVIGEILRMHFYISASELFGR